MPARPRICVDRDSGRRVEHFGAGGRIFRSGADDIERLAVRSSDRPGGRGDCALGERQTYFLGGWAPPAGIALRADGFSVAMPASTALVVSAAGGFAYLGNYRTPDGVIEVARR
jgi:hypothetical protein